MNEEPKPLRGFAKMDRAQLRDLAARGGRAAHAMRAAHEWTSESARASGRKGGLASARRRQERLEYELVACDLDLDLWPNDRIVQHAEAGEYQAIHRLAQLHAKLQRVA